MTRSSQEDAERIAFIERQARLERDERRERREEITKRVLWICLPIVAFCILAGAILVINHVAMTPDPNPTCDVTKLHLRPGEAVTLTCPVTLTRDRSIP